MAQPSSNIIVAISTVADGTMLDKTRPFRADIVENRRRWLDSLGIDINRTSLVPLKYEGEDYCRYAIVDDANPGHGLTGGGAEPADALVTTTPGRALFLPVADCIATTLYDPRHRVLMLSHLGRHSLEQGGGIKSVQFLQEHYGSKPKELLVWASPAVGKDSYKIYKLDDKGMKEVLHEQLGRAGVAPGNITDFAEDTATHDDYYSHSAFLQGKKPENGRFAMVAMILPE